jgi:hypothetical protein
MDDFKNKSPGIQQNNEITSDLRLSIKHIFGSRINRNLVA